MFAGAFQAPREPSAKTRIVTSSLPLLVFNMGSISQEPRRLFQWTVCAYRKPGMSEEDYHKYMSEKHAPLVRGLLAKYGIIKFTMASISAAPA